MYFRIAHCALCTEYTAVSQGPFFSPSKLFDICDREAAHEWSCRLIQTMCIQLHLFEKSITLLEWMLNFYRHKPIMKNDFIEQRWKVESLHHACNWTWNTFSHSVMAFVYSSKLNWPLSPYRSTFLLCKLYTWANNTLKFWRDNCVRHQANFSIGLKIAGLPPHTKLCSSPHSSFLFIVCLFRMCV